MYHNAIFRADRSSRCRDIAVLRFFKMETVRHLGFGKIRNFNYPYPSDSQCVTVSNFALNGQTVAKIWPFVHVSRWRPSAILALLYAFGPPTNWQEEYLVVFVTVQNLVWIGECRGKLTRRMEGSHVHCCVDTVVVSSTSVKNFVNFGSITLRSCGSFAWVVTAGKLIYVLCWLKVIRYRWHSQSVGK